jgi:integrase
MACLRKKGNKYYVKDVIDGKEKWFRTGTDVYKIAEVHLNDYVNAKKLGTPSPFPTETPLTDMLSAFCKNLKGTSRKTNYTKEISRLRMIFGPTCPELAARGSSDDDAGQDTDLRITVTNLEHLTTKHVTDLQDDLAVERALSGKTLNNYREILHRFVNWATTQKGIRFPGGKNPIDAVAIRKQSTSPISYLGPDQIVQQLEALKDFFVLQAMVALLIFAGLRREELLWLRTCDILDRDGNLTILVHAKTIDGKYWQPKNKKDRSVPVSATLRPYLKRVLPDGPEERWLFTSIEGKRWDPDNFSTVLREANIAAVKRQAENGREAMPIWSCLDYRHTFGTMLASSGLSLYIIAEWMGNSPEVCRKHYAKLIPGLVDKFIDFMRPTGSAVANSQLADAFGKVIPDQPVTAPPRQFLRLVVNKR